MATPSETLTEFRRQFHDSATECERFGALCRSSRLQGEHAGKLRATRARVTEAKEALIASGVEDGANELLAYEFVLNALASELEMYIALKRDDSGAAWTHLVNAQVAASCAVKAHAIGARLEQAYIPRLHALEGLLFPKQMFASVGIIVEHAECSICGGVYGDCDHVKGRPYMGRFCACVIKKCKLLEVSVVDNPADKHCRVLWFGDEKGVRRDPLSLEAVEVQSDAPADGVGPPQAP